ncbi:tol-pal system protein YbgF [Thiomicrorhabdus sp. Milos-T2]|uniref:tol-pal system protein YbgF n=1 Tax=Thiomicrorhabdus sp. Milos-T2 TaxID=90814 RepID=UPI0004941746|nr:tol-pal system protein YbgF [Thiomicrorhabdus sp. Milos-T2]
MRKFVLMSTVSALCLSVAIPAQAVQGATLDQRVNRLERMLENPVLLQLSRRLGEQQRDIQTLQDENDRLKRDLRNFKALMDKRYKESDERFSALEGGQSPVQLDKKVLQTPLTEKIDQPKEDQPKKDQPKDSQLASPENTLKQELTVNAKEVEIQSKNNQPKETLLTPIKTRKPTQVEKDKYKEAFALMRASKYEASITAFQGFLAKYPESDLASNAAYWSGEGYLIKDENEAALDSFMLVIKRYPDSTKVPDAKLRAADSYVRLGNEAAAKTLYQNIIDSRPHSKAAKNAKKRLEKQ